MINRWKFYFRNIANTNFTNMKERVLLVLFLMGIFTGLVQAQQRPHYTQYVLNNFIINPAVAGIENYTDVKLSHRHQWVGLQDAPITTYVTLHGSIGKKDSRTNPTSFLPPGENPRGQAYWEDYTAPEPHHGWGATLINDRTGPLTRFSAYGTYAYHRAIGQRTTLSAGISLGVTNNTLNTTKLIFDNPIDPAVASSDLINNLKPDINAGLWLYSPDYYVGLSALQIINQDFTFAADTLKLSQKSYPHLFFTAGYKFYAGENFSIIPSAVVRYVNPLPVGVDLMVKAQYQDRFWFGGGYRINDGVVGMVGVNISSTLNIGYSYDYTTSPLQPYTQGSHEFVIGFLIGNRYGDLCPRNLW
jgi:type IX secretion system PorP/SprF family membrane protein